MMTYKNLMIRKNKKNRKNWKTSKQAAWLASWPPATLPLAAWPQQEEQEKQ